jgi:hypothetical protein
MKARLKNIIVFKLLFVALLCVSSLSSLDAQKFEVRSYLGVAYYQGDLSPLPINLSFSKGHAMVGVSSGYHFNKFLSVHTKFLRGKLSGNDLDASDINRRKRNLSFETSLVEYGVTTEFNFNAIFKKLDKYGLELYYTTGVNIFKFNPRTTFNDRLVDLQPLGTEGQNLPGVGADEPYKLTQFNLPFGFGTRFKVGDLYSFGIEISPRYTFTDYIDDVSGDYVSYDELIEGPNGALSATLANRMGEFLGTPPLDVETGTVRGDQGDNDWYLFTGVYFSYKIGAALPVLPPSALFSPAAGAVLKQ